MPPPLSLFIKLLYKMLEPPVTKSVLTNQVLTTKFFSDKLKIATVNPTNNNVSKQGLYQFYQAKRLYMFATLRTNHHLSTLLHFVENIIILYYKDKLNNHVSSHNIHIDIYSILLGIIWFGCYVWYCLVFLNNYSLI